MKIGVWTTADPLGFADGPNLYAYVHHNPIAFMDLDGTTSYEQQTYLPWYKSCYNGFMNTIKEYRVGTRIQEGLQAIAGGCEAAAGGTLALGTSWSGAGPVAGCVILGHGVDNAWAGLNQMWTGYPQETATVQLLEKAGMSHGAATLTNDCIFMTGLGICAGGTRLANTLKSPIKE